MDNPKILVIDGDPKNLQILKESLEAAKFRVITTGSGEEAWGLIQTQKPNIIVSEVDIPGLDGFQLLERLQKNPIHAAIPLVFLTNRRNLEDRIKSLRTGVKDYMIKPLHVKEVIARLQMILRRMARLKTDETDTSRKIVGRLEDQSVEQLLENYGVEKRTGVLSLYDSFDRSGEIYFREGAVVNARLGNFRAEKAVYQMLPWDRGHYIMTFKNVNVQPEITVSNLGLLLQGYKRIQARDKLLQQLPDVQTVMIRTPLFEQILKRKTVSQDAIKFIALFDGRRTIDQVLAESMHDDVKTLNRIVRLYEQGFIHIEGATPQIPDIEINSSAIPDIEKTRAHREMHEIPPEFKKLGDHLATDPSSKMPPEQPPQVFSDFSRAKPMPTPLPIQPDESHREQPVPDNNAQHKPSRQTPPPKQPHEEAEPKIFQPKDEKPASQPGTNGSSIRRSSQAPGAFNTIPDFDSLFNGNGQNAGHFVIISSSHQQRRQFISSLTSGQFSSKSLGDEGDLIELGRVVTPKQRSVDIIGLSTEQKFVQLLEQVSPSLVGYVVLIKGDDPSSLKYTGYLINSLQKKIQAPHVIALVQTVQGKKIPLDFIRYSLQLDEKEQIVEVDAADVNSLMYVIGQLKTPDYLTDSPKRGNLLQSTPQQ